jgi:hypothetical protein
MIEQPSAVFSSAERRKRSGAHYTPPSLADFVAGKIVESVDAVDAARALRVLDPAIGDGQLLVSLLGILKDRGVVAGEVCGFDTDGTALEKASARITGLAPNAHAKFERRDFLDFAMECARPSLFSASGDRLFDVVIANPPYVRTQHLPAGGARRLSEAFGLGGRVDLAHAFVVAISDVLKPGGVAGVIVSNRFMTTQAGAKVREAVLARFEVIHVWDLGDSQIFDAAVLPAVLLLRRIEQRSAPARRARFTAVYSAAAAANARRCPTLLDAIDRYNAVELENGKTFRVERGELDHGQSAAGVWRISNGRTDDWLAKVRSATTLTFGDLGPVRVGVKTTADRVFIRTDWDALPANERPELLRPLLTHRVARPFKAKEAEGRGHAQILYPHEVRGGVRRPIDLNEHPRSRAYLEAHRRELERRTYVIEAGRRWYEIWVPQDPEAWAAPKVVFRDISAQPVFWMDLSGAVVNGDCYWLAGRKGRDDDALWLALAVGNSSFAIEFYDRSFNNRLYSERRRFITQYVEKFPLPDPAGHLAREMVALAKRIFSETPSATADRLAEELDELTWRAFGLTREETSRQGDL